jgi:hypothetical protein
MDRFLQLAEGDWGDKSAEWLDAGRLNVRQIEPGTQNQNQDMQAKSIVTCALAFIGTRRLGG